MPRDASGNFTLVVGNPVAPHTLIEADWANTTLDDVAAALTDSLSRTGSGGMLVGFKNADGTMLAPGMSWTNEPTSGWYRAGLNDFWYSVGNENIFRITKNGIELGAGKQAFFSTSAAILVQDAEPVTTASGAEWYESDTGNLYMRYRSPDNSLTWVGINQTGGNFAALGPGGRLPPSALPLGGINALIGGDFSANPWQRGTNFPAMVTTTFMADRWEYRKTGTNVSVFTGSKSADAPTFAECGRLVTDCLMLDCTTADAVLDPTDTTIVRQSIEGYNFLPMAQRPLTLSFWHKHSKIGTYCAALRNGASDRSVVVEYAQLVADVWEYVAIPLPASPSAGTWNYTNGAGVRVDFTLVCGSNFIAPAPGVWQSSSRFGTANQVNAADAVGNKFRLALVQLELGDVASPFQARSFSDELDLCRRYFQKSFNTDVAPAQFTGDFNGSATVQIQVAGVAGACSTMIGFAPAMRVSPSVTTYNTSAFNANWRNATGGVDSGVPSVVSAGTSGATLFNPQVAADGVQDRCSIHWSADAEI